MNSIFVPNLKILAFFLWGSEVFDGSLYRNVDPTYSRIRIDLKKFRCYRVAGLTRLWKIFGTGRLLSKPATFPDPCTFFRIQSVPNRIRTCYNLWYWVLVWINWPIRTWNAICIETLSILSPSSIITPTCKARVDRIRITNYHRVCWRKPLT
jgi:hypothetical protein